MDVPKTPGDNSVVPPTAHCAVHNKNVNVNFSTFIVSPSDKVIIKQPQNLIQNYIEAQLMY